MKIPEDLKYYIDKYCYKCGAKLVLKSRYRESYHGETGRPQYMYIIECPRANWWNIFSSHTSNKYLVCGSDTGTVLEVY